MKALYLIIPFAPLVGAILADVIASVASIDPVMGGVDR